MKVSFISFALAAVATPCQGFLNLPFLNQANPALVGYAEAQDALLKIHFDIGQVQLKKGAPVISGNRLGIDGMVIELHGKDAVDYKCPSLPGANGPNPQLSSGAKPLDLLKKGKFVDLTGTRVASLDNGVWEMVWRQNAKAGALICGFDVPEKVERNNASIPKGRVYITFPMWTSGSLQDLRERKAKAEEKAGEAMDRLKEETRLMEETSNPLMKAMHFRNACKAHEDIDYSGYRSYQSMPLEREMVNLRNGLHLASLGTVWTKKEGFFGEHVLLGSASVSAAAHEELSEKKPVTERELKPTAFDGLRPFK
jgi:hypothetical protein